MGFMTPSATGADFKVFISFNAKAGRWYTKRDGKDEPQFEVADMTAVFDMPGLKTGWFKFSAGVAPEKVMDPSFTSAAANPGQDFKRGFMLDLLPARRQAIGDECNRHAYAPILQLHRTDAGIQSAL